MFALTACGGLDPSGPHPEFATTLPPPATVMASSNGAIFQATTGYAALTSGNRAARVGDILTIRLVERTIAAKSNSAATSRSGTFGLTPPSTGPLALFSGSDINTGGNQSFSGDGKAAQSNSLSGEISVTVAEVFANGSMRITGEKLLNLNRGQESVRLSGLVRAADIGADNRVLSTNVADARIAYSGSGEIARASKQGWLQKFFSAVSPF
ncbi:MAG: flagellar basal body L-ring protein FlgH [Parasphingorhabdus sp.]|nr:flagellar basal body L-ring protein FlgH [Parasphingorhabdus sp.]